MPEPAAPWLDHVTFINDPRFPVLFCCDGFASGGLCDPWCEIGGDPHAWAERSHLGVLEYADTHCDQSACWCNEEADDAD